MWTTGVLLNAFLFEFVYPGWSLRVYHDIKSDTDSCRQLCKARSMYSFIQLCHIDYSVPESVLGGLHQDKPITGMQLNQYFHILLIQTITFFFICSCNLRNFCRNKPCLMFFKCASVRTMLHYSTSIAAFQPYLVLCGVFCQCQTQRSTLSCSGTRTASWTLENKPLSKNGWPPKRLLFIQWMITLATHGLWWLGCLEWTSTPTLIPVERMGRIQWGASWKICWSACSTWLQLAWTTSKKLTRRCSSLLWQRTSKVRSALGVPLIVPSYAWSE